MLTELLTGLSDSWQHRAAQNDIRRQRSVWSGMPQGDLWLRDETGLERLRAWCQSCREPSGSWPRSGGHRRRASPSGQAGGHRYGTGANVVLTGLVPDLLTSAARPWSVLGPHSIGNRWFQAGTSGHDRRARIAGHAASAARTSDGEPGWGRVQVPPPTRPIGLRRSARTSTIRACGS
jgi:hypothetical protein